MKIYAVANQKGGVGKTTSVINLGAMLGKRGLKTLIVDIDPQANATSSMGVDKFELEASTYDMLIEEVGSDQIKKSVETYGVDVLPANPALAGAEVELVTALGREYRLQTADHRRRTAEEIESLRERRARRRPAHAGAGRGAGDARRPPRKRIQPS